MNLARICGWICVAPLAPPVERSELARLAEQVGALPTWLEGMLSLSDGLRTETGTMLTAAEISVATVDLRRRSRADPDLWETIATDLVPFFRRSGGCFLAYHRTDVGIYQVTTDEASLEHSDWMAWLASEVRQTLVMELQVRQRNAPEPAHLKNCLDALDLDELIEVMEWMPGASLDGAETIHDRVEKIILARRVRRDGAILRAEGSQRPRSRPHPP